MNIGLSVRKVPADAGTTRQPGRVLERIRPVGVEEPAAIGAQLLDGLLRGHRAARDDLPHAVQHVVDASRPGQRLQGALGYEDDRDHKRDRQQDVDRAADQVDPEVTDRVRALAGEPPSARRSPLRRPEPQ